ncbi:MAG: AbrB/MazE/SpoVT family DNA-binding domain-containing protein [Anaerolineae bacterium]|jgi:AbrB family looped-hinge helix DNA binding protein
MLARLSSKGQLVIPKAVRQALDLRPGTPIHVRVKDKEIILQPLGVSQIEALYGKYAGTDLLDDLEVEHRQELQDEEPLRP